HRQTISSGMATDRFNGKVAIYCRQQAGCTEIEMTQVCSFRCAKLQTRANRTGRLSARVSPLPMFGKCLCKQFIQSEMRVIPFCGRPEIPTLDMRQGKMRYLLAHVVAEIAKLGGVVERRLKHGEKASKHGTEEGKCQ